MQINILIIGVFLMFTFLSAGDGVKAGDEAPDFALKDHQGKLHRLQDYKGQYVALYFYPKDDTPGCTAQACNLRDNFTLLEEKGIAILGVSYDDSVSHNKFAAKYELPFPLLSDTDKSLAKSYGASGGMLGLTARRITYLIGPDGKIVHVFDKVDVANHADQIVAMLPRTNE